MLESQEFLADLEEKFGGEILPDGRLKVSREGLENCAAGRGATVSVSHAKNFALGIHVPTISVRRVENKGAQTETETLFFSYEEEGGAIVTDPSEWGRIPVQVFG
ncbi:MAG: hypothetical protein V3V62_08275 [bacterium]